MDLVLSQECQGHTADVRGVCCWGDRIVSCSRDKTVCVWRLGEGSGANYVLEKRLEGHGEFVNAVDAYAGQAGGGFVVSGSKDKTAMVWNSAFEIGAVLSGHTDAVCNVKINRDGTQVLTSSWDNTARLWDVASAACLLTLAEHESVVWSAVFLPNDCIATASADKKIRIFPATNGSTPSPNRVLTHHTDVCRSVALIGSHLVSSSNDGKVFVADATGESEIHVLDEHDGFPVYDVCGNTGTATTAAEGTSDQILVTASEDKNVKVFVSSGGSKFSHAQTLPHPTGIWGACLLPNGDVASAGADGTVRIWTRDRARAASDELIQAYDLKLASQTVSSNMVGQIDATQLPGVESLVEPGATDGQKKIINNDGTVEIYQWTNANWLKIGNVVDTEKKSEKKTIDGVPFDHVFNVDIKEGAPPLKLGFNRGEDPWMVAQQFLWKHELPQEYLGQVADFIFK